MFEKRQKNGITYFVSTLLEKCGFENAFCTKDGGVSRGCFASLNMSFTRKDENGLCDSIENVRENYSTPINSIAAKQVHQNTVKIATGDDGGLEILRESPVGYDAVLVKGDNKKINTACIKTADCVPILMCNTKTGDVCAVHAGWRGTTLDIVSHSARALSENPKDIVCAIGPSISLCCYEVGDEVYYATKALFETKGILERTEEMFVNISACSMTKKRHANLSRINKALLENMGVPEENIEVSNICTSCTKDENGQHVFFSHRGQNGYSGTFLSVVKTRERAIWQNTYGT